MFSSQLLTKNTQRPSIKKMKKHLHSNLKISYFEGTSTFFPKGHQRYTKGLIYKDLFTFENPLALRVSCECNQKKEGWMLLRDFQFNPILTILSTLPGGN